MDSSSGRRYILYVAGAAAGAAAYLLLRPSRNGGSSSSKEATDFDAFLRTPRPQPAARAAQATSFESFLRRQPESQQPVSTDFASFLRSAAPAAAGSSSSQTQQLQQQQEVIPEGAAPVLVLYGTEYGFAREIAEKVAAQLKADGRFWPQLVNAADRPDGLTDLATQQAALLVFSTQGDGVPPTEARGFCDWLTGGQAGSLPGLHYSVCALGDSSYTHFCRCGKQLDTALAAAGAAPLLPRSDIDKEDWPAVDAWIDGAAAALTALLAGGALKTFADLGGVPAALGGNGSSSGEGDKKTKRHSKSRPYYARVAAVEGLCVLAGPDDKDTVRLRLELGPDADELGLTYAPGDALGIWPTNPPELVDEVLTQLGVSGDEAAAPPSWHYQEQQEEEQGSSGSSLRHVLSVCYDLKTPKVQPLLRLILEQLIQQQAAAAAAVNGSRPSFDLQADATARAAGAAAAAAEDDGKAAPKQQQQQEAAVLASHVAAAEALLADGSACEVYLAARHVADVLQGFPSVRLSTTQLLSVLRPLQPRLYSISSSPLEFSPPSSGVEATIAVVRYQALGKQRQGICSTQVAERLAVGRLLPVFISRNPDFRLPPDPARPLIMVGPGTGLAPFRAFILQRLLEQGMATTTTTTAAAAAATADQTQAAAAAAGPMHLFFGCRRRDQDFLYAGQLSAWHDGGSITLHTAFSREGAAKVYVQQRLREAGQEVWRLLQAGAHFYVCGDAGSMAGAVQEALLEIIRQGQQQPQAGEQAGAGVAAVGDGAAAQAEAQAYLDQLAAEGRYQRDVWFS